MEDRSDHRLECHIMEDLSLLPDISRITARLLLKLEEGGDEQSEPLPFSQGERCFQELASHADKIEDGDQCARQIFDSLSGLIPSATGSWQRFKQVYGRLIINSFEISGEEEDEDKLGWALYLAPSILDHSCVPSAEVYFQGKKIIIKSRVTMRPKDLSRNSISFVDRTKPFSERRETLSRQFSVLCRCEMCRDFTLLRGRLRAVLGPDQTCAMSAVQELATGKQRHYFRSVRYEGFRLLAITVGST